jgi:uncharacterized protein (UPF0332 family)
MRKLLDFFNREFVKTGEIPVLTKTIEKLFSERQIGDYDIESYLSQKRI